VQSLIEFGWSQLQSGDYEGAIGNMYSMQSPFFNALYKPESFVIRSIGYLKLCQYGDAYRSLTLLENEYRPVFDSLNKYMGDQPKAYQTVRKFLAGPASAKEVDGLSTHLIRELARHRDFINAQKSINRQIDERASYAKFAGQVDRELKRVQERVTSLRIRINELRKQIVVELKHPDSRAQVADISSQADQAMNDLNQAFFDIDILKVARDSWPEYNRDVVAGADRRLSAMTKDLDRILTNRLVRMQNDLSRILDNNELLRYEVFAGSGENLRYQVSGGERGQRVPDNVIPKSKSLQWHFDGEFWEDEIGHYRSSLKNNCPSVEPKLEAGGQVAAGQSTQGAE
jgi:hypothetical protein